jgi:hypothetical protein
MAYENTKVVGMHDWRVFSNFYSCRTLNPMKRYVFAWVCVDAILLERQGTKLALVKICLFAWYQRYCNFFKRYVSSSLLVLL